MSNEEGLALCMLSCSQCHGRSLTSRCCASACLPRVLDKIYIPSRLARFRKEIEFVGTNEHISLVVF